MIRGQSLMARNIPRNWETGEYVVQKTEETASRKG
jgi:hypothetical protein